MLVDKFGGGELVGGGCGGGDAMLVDKFCEGGGKAGIGSNKHG
jgi:hypothetical protein